MKERFNPKPDDNKEFLDLIGSIENDDDLSPEFKERLLDFVCAGKKKKFPVHKLKKIMEDNREALLREKRLREEHLQEEQRQDERLDALVGPGDSARIRGQAGQMVADQIRLEREKEKNSRSKKPN